MCISADRLLPSATTPLGLYSTALRLTTWTIACLVDMQPTKELLPSSEYLIHNGDSKCTDVPVIKVRQTIPGAGAALVRVIIFS